MASETDEPVRCVPGSRPRGAARRRRHPRGWASVGGVVLGLLAASIALPAGITDARPAAGPDPMLVVDVEALSVEEQLTFASLQGIVNRAGPRLYLVGLRSAQDFDVDPTAEAWLTDVVDVPFERVTPAEALDRLLGEVAGMVVWDPAVPYESQNVATTIAGRDDLLPVGPDQVAGLADDHGLEVEVDLRDLALTTDRQFTEWAIANLDPPAGGWSFPVWTGRPRNGKPVQPGLRDWAVANRAFVFDADPATEPGLLGQVMDLFPAGTGVYGYVFFDTEVYRSIGLPANEALGVSELTDRGNWLIPTTDATNMTVHAKSAEPARPARWDDAPRTPDDDKTYVSFVISDGDALGYDITLLRSLQYAHLDDRSIPIGVSTSPLLATHAPAIWNWYLDNLPANANLVAGPSGSGYFFPSYASDADEERFLTRSRTDLDATGLRSTWSINPILTPSPSTGDIGRMVDAFAPSSLYLDYTPGAPLSPAVSYAGDVPITRIAMATKPEEIAPAIRASIAKQPDGPRFVSIGLVTWGTNADDAAAAIAEFGDDVVAVAPDEFAGLLKGAAADGYTGSPDRRTIPTPEVGACRADPDQIDWGTYPVVAAFIADRILGADLPAQASAEGTEMQVDADALATQVLDTFRALGPLAFSADAVASGSATARVSDLERVTSEGDGSLRAAGRYSFEVTFDPGDGTRTASLSVPVTCRASATGTGDPGEPAPTPDAATPLPGNPAYTG